MSQQTNVRASPSVTAVAPGSLTQEKNGQEELKYHITYRVEKFIICVDPDSE